MGNGQKKEIKFIDLFGGVGGFRYGIEKAQGERNKKSRTNNSLPDRELSAQGRRKHTFNCVFYCDTDKYAVQTYNRNFREHYKPTDITIVKATDIPDFDLLCAGFPCQAFSIAGKRKGFRDTRGTLFFEIARIVKAKRPSYIFLENVKGLLNHEKGQTFRIILQTLDELGYDYQWVVLNSKFFGVPQSRERVFIIANTRRTGRPEILPFRECGKKINKQPKGISQQVASTVFASQHKIARGMTLIYQGAIMSEKDKKQLKHGKKLSRNFSQGQRVYSSEGIASTIAGNAGGIYAVLTPDRLNKRQNGRRFKADEEPMFTLNTQDKHGVMEKRKIRRLTPIECERLQGFPDNWTEGVSDTQRYKMMGNAVTVNVIEAIARNWLV